MDSFIIKTPRPQKGVEVDSLFSSMEPSQETPRNTQDKITIYTDGACSNNGRSNARAGYGIYFGEGDPRNKSQPCPGAQTNNVAELTAIIEALKLVTKELQQNVPVVIYSDSSYAIKCCTSYGAKCQAQNWVRKKGAIPNVTLVKQAYQLCQTYKSISFIHVLAHTGLTDKHSIGNDHADRLANQAIGVTSCPYQQSTPKNIYLGVPFGDKEEAKKLGAKWDPKKKKWYTTASNPGKQELLKRWANTK